MTETDVSIVESESQTFLSRKDVMKSKRRRFLDSTFFVLLAVFTLAIVVYIASLTVQNSKIKQQVLNQHYSSIDSSIQALVSEQRNVGMTLALNLAQTDTVRALFCKTCDASVQSFNLEEFKAGFQHLAEIDRTWIQVFDAQGISLMRSWTLDNGDDLKGIRPEVALFLENHKAISVLSVGKYSLTHKIIVPVFDQQREFLGGVEVILPLKSLVSRIEYLFQAKSVILIEERFRPQLTRILDGRRIGGRYIAESSVSDNLAMTLLNHTTPERVWLEGDYVVTAHPLRDTNQEVLGYWYSFESEQSVFNNEYTGSMRHLWLAAFLLFLSVAGLLGVLWSHQRYKQLYKHSEQILNSINDIVLIYQNNQLVSVNQAFYDKFLLNDGLDEFMTKYPQGVSALWVDSAETQAFENDELWLREIERNYHDEMRVSSLHGGFEQLFKVKMYQPNDLVDDFIIVLQDITLVESYKKRLMKQTATDPLTKVGNRITFQNSLVREIQVAHRYKTPFSLVLFDLDFFRRLNTDFGHQMGDLVLQNIAKTVSDFLRETDEICRYGGEEFAVLMPQTSLKDASFTAERLRGTIEFINPEGLPENITASFGVATLDPNDGSDNEPIVNRVERAMNEAKRNGRNCVFVAHQDSIERFKPELFDN